MKHWLAAIVTFLVLTGVGCAAFSFRSSGVDAPAPVTEPVDALLAVVGTRDADGRRLELILPDGSVEDVDYGELDASLAEEGTLVRVSGVRDLSTRAIRAEALDREQAAGIRVTSPAPGATVTSPVVVFGFVRAETGEISWQLSDQDGAVADHGSARLSDAPQDAFVPFRLELFPPAFERAAFTLELSVRGRDGRDQDAVSLPLSLLSADATDLTLYFAHDAQGSARDCSLVFPVTRRIARTSAVARAAAVELVKGPTVEEMASGYRSRLPPETSLRSLSVTDEGAVADFSAALGRLPSNCRNMGIRAQLAQTLLAVPGVHDVSVLVEGVPAPAFQP